MKNKYVDFISDEHFIQCVANLHKAYIKAKNDISKKKFYSNKVDTFKLTFDSQFNETETLLPINFIQRGLDVDNIKS